MKKAAIIGAGVGGIATAIRLAKKGYDVSVFESNSYPGGKLSQLKSDKFRFDAGPSLFTMPELVDELFLLSGKNPTDFFSYQRLDETCRYFFDDGTVLNGFSDPTNFAKEASSKTSVKSKDVLKHLKQSKFIYDSTAFLFLRKSLHKCKSYLSLKVLWAFIKLPFLHIFSSMNAVNTKALKDDKMVQLFNRFATYNGSDPFKAPGILNIIPHLEFNKGAYFPDNGMYSISSSLYDLALSMGVSFHFDSKVDEIIVEGSSAQGVSINSQLFTADLVVCNIDVHFVYQHLLPKIKKPKRILQQERSSSALIYYWGVNGEFPDLDLHNIFFSSNYEKEFEYLSNKNKIYQDPTVYVNITAKKNKSDAPEKHENWFVMINVPSNENQDWEKLIAEARVNIIRKLNKVLKVDLESLIVFEEILEPRTIESKTGSYKGSLYGTASNNKMSAFFRHPNFSSDISNLYFCGGSVHPGGGIPLALSSAKIVADLIKQVK